MHSIYRDLVWLSHKLAFDSRNFLFPLAHFSIRDAAPEINTSGFRMWIGSRNTRVVPV